MLHVALFSFIVNLGCFFVQSKNTDTSWQELMFVRKTPRSDLWMWLNTQLMNVRKVHIMSSYNVANNVFVFTMLPKGIPTWPVHKGEQPVMFQPSYEQTETEFFTECLCWMVDMSSVISSFLSSTWGDDEIWLIFFNRFETMTTN